MLGNRQTLNRARALEQMARSRSPLAAQTALPPPTPRSRAAFLAATLGNLGGEPLRITVTPGGSE
jgi:hypothetical protein